MKFKFITQLNNISSHVNVDTSIWYIHVPTTMTHNEVDMCHIREWSIIIDMVVFLKVVEA